MLVQETAQVLKQAVHDIRVDILAREKRLIIYFAFLDQQLLNAGCGVALVHDRHALEEVGEQLEVALYVLIWDLVPEHVYKLYTCGF